jgi:serine/threonine-protein kinase HipA
MVFNIIARNHDDHTKNIAFLMGKDGKWKLSPAFDVIWAYNSSGPWTNQHQMTINGKRDGFTRADLLAPAKQFGVKNANTIIEEVVESVSKWSKVAGSVGVTASMIERIGETHRLEIK